MKFLKYTKPLLFAIVAVGMAACFSQLSCGRKPALKQTDHKLLVLGFDGMDPALLDMFIKRGGFPNFKKLIAVNGITKLRTSDPPQSPVAWSNFITGMNPGGHGIYDFIHRKPETYEPYLSTSETTDPEWEVIVGKYKIPLKGGGVKLLRKGTAFWEILENNQIPSTMFRVPANFPPVQAGKSLSGMGTPDILGGYGSFTYFTERPFKSKEEVTGGVVVDVAKAGGKYTCAVQGPPNSMMKDFPGTSITIDVWTDPENESAKIKVGGETLIMQEGDWSKWVHVSFEMIPHMSSVPGIIVIYLKQVHPYLQMYVSPVNIDPAKPAAPISYPKEYSVELAKKVGPFYTTGMPEDTKALGHGILTDREYLAQNQILNRSIRKMYDFELSRFDSGLLFFYFSDTDLTGHMMWSAMDETHPMYSTRDRSVQDSLYNVYKDMDKQLGIAMKKLGPKDTLLVISDHGFNPFIRTFNLNTWLKNNGYLTIDDEYTMEQSEYLSNVVWEKTKAYGLGFNALYINQIGREGKGTVPPGEQKRLLMEEIKSKLEKEIDPTTGQKVVTRVYFASEIYTGEHVDQAPDLLIGYNKTYRASWETAIGKLTKNVLGDNDQKWAGDHLIDASHVPGVVFSNRKIKMKNPALYDIPATILAEFGIEPPGAMVGRSIFK